MARAQRVDRTINRRPRLRIVKHPFRGYSQSAERRPENPADTGTTEGLSNRKGLLFWRSRFERAKNARGQLLRRGAGVEHQGRVLAGGVNVKVVHGTHRALVVVHDLGAGAAALAHVTLD